MKKIEATDLGLLRKLFGEPMKDAAPNGWHQISAGKWRKAYGPPTRQRWRIRACRLQLRHDLLELRPAESLAPLIDGRSILELRADPASPLRQLMIRATSGDVDAIRALVLSIQEQTELLANIKKRFPNEIKSVAEECEKWPFVLSRRKRDQVEAADELRELSVGSKSPVPYIANQKRNPSGYFGQLAATAFEVCREIRELLPELKKHCRDVKGVRKKLQFWNQERAATFYYVNAEHVIVIADWEERSLDLSLPVAAANFNQWWQCIHDYALEYWHSDRSEYDKALGCFDPREHDRGDRDTLRRFQALDRLKQAAEDLFGLRMNSYSQTEPT